MKLVLSKRIMNATVEQVYDAYSKPEILIQWWGPHGFTNRFNEFNFREEGLWDYHMIDSNGKEYHNQTIFKTILPNSKIIANHISAPFFEFEIDFIKINEQQTEVHFKMKFEDELVYNALKDYVPEKNEENFDRLEIILASL
jgi:uncharacterized protein YndB with AHSA1/START domain